MLMLDNNMNFHLIQTVYIFNFKGLLNLLVIQPRIKTTSKKKKKKGQNCFFLTDWYDINTVNCLYILQHAYFRFTIHLKASGV